MVRRQRTLTSDRALTGPCNSGVAVAPILVQRNLRCLFLDALIQIPSLCIEPQAKAVVAPLLFGILHLQLDSILLRYQHHHGK